MTNLIESIILNEEIENEIPFYVCDLDDVRRKIEIWNNHLHRVHPFYAVKVSFWSIDQSSHYELKCNHDAKLLKLLADHGCGFDVASKNEIEKVLNLTSTSNMTPCMFSV